MAGYYRHFVENFSRIAVPLTHLTQKGVPFVWDDSYEEAFNELKYRLTTARVLALSERGLGYVIYCDASRLGLGCILMQLDHVITYAYR